MHFDDLKDELHTKEKEYYQSLNETDKMDFIDNKMNEVLRDYGYKIEKVSVKPKPIEEFLFFKKPNVIILKEDKISDEYNYVASLQYFLGILNKYDLFKQDKIVFIYLMEFPIHYLITFLLELSYNYNIEVYFPQSQIDEYQLKELEETEDDEGKTGNIKILNLDDAVTNNYLVKN